VIYICTFLETNTSLRRKKNDPPYIAALAQNNYMYCIFSGKHVLYLSIILFVPMLAPRITAGNAISPFDLFLTCREKETVRYLHHKNDLE
jgi:hypothetical protein